MKKEIEEWVEEELHIFDNRTIGDGFQFGRRNKEVNVCVRLLFFCLSFYIVGDGVIHVNCLRARKFPFCLICNCCCMLLGKFSCAFNKSTVNELMFISLFELTNERCYIIVK